MKRWSKRLWAQEGLTPRGTFVHRMSARVSFCRVCGDPGHRSCQCPNIQSEEEDLAHLQSVLAMETTSHHSWEEPTPSNASMKSFLPVERSSPKKSPKAKAKTAAAGVGGGSKPEQYRLDQGEEEINIQDLTPQEMARIAKSRAKAQQARVKREETRALTGVRADYPTLSRSYSEEIAFNMIWCLRSKMMS